MGYFGKLEDRHTAQKLRRQGLSYTEILQTIHVSKDTISRWCKDIPLSTPQKEKLLRNKQLGQKKGSLIAAENKRNKRIRTTEALFKKAKRDIATLTKRDKFLTGIALYVAEGDKTGNKIGFANSDPRLISFMMEWLLEFTKLPMDRFRGAIWLHEGLSEKKAKNFWSEVTGISIANFHKTYIARNKVNSKKIRKNIHQYGVFSIRCSDSTAHRQILGWISAVFSDKMSV